MGLPKATKSNNGRFHISLKVEHRIGLDDLVYLYLTLDSTDNKSSFLSACKQNLRYDSSFHKHDRFDHLYVNKAEVTAALNRIVEWFPEFNGEKSKFPIDQIAK